MKLQCTVCGGHAGNFKQWWNQDTSWGICKTCAVSELAHYGPEEMRKTYGVEGVNYERLEPALETEDANPNY